MTIEEKARAYDEALEKARDMLSYKEVRHEDMEYLFPELKESEDEMIRKEIISYLKTSTCIIPENKYKQWIAWLEKQGEQKPVEWSKEDEKMLNQCAAAIHAADYYNIDDKNEMEKRLKSIRLKSNKNQHKNN